MIIKNLVCQYNINFGINLLVIKYYNFRGMLEIHAAIE